MLSRLSLITRPFSSSPSRLARNRLRTSNTSRRPIFADGLEINTRGQHGMQKNRGEQQQHQQQQELEKDEDGGGHESGQGQRPDIPTVALGGFLPGFLPRRVGISLARMGYSSLTDVQRAVIPSALRGRDVVASAVTGTGKTEAYAIPVVARVWSEGCRGGAEGHGGAGDAHASIDAAAPQRRGKGGADNDGGKASARARVAAFVVAPTKELVEQIGSRMASVAFYCGERVQVCRAGTLAPFSPMRPVVDLPAAAPVPRDAKPARVVVATPGTLATWLESDPSLTRTVRCVVVDECDKMLDLGLAGDMERLRKVLPKPRRNAAAADKVQTLLVSATLPPRVWDLMYRMAPKHRLVQLNAALRPVDTIDHIRHTVTARRKRALVVHLLRRRGKMEGKQVLIFARTRQRCDGLVEALNEAGIGGAVTIHKGISDARRRENLEAFRNGEVRCLVATDVAARGVDIPTLEFVINFDLPADPNEYIHRAGRTARLQGRDAPLRGGTCISLVSHAPQLLRLGGAPVELDEKQLVRSISQAVGNGGVRECKVPGPWRDCPDPAEVEAVRGESRRLAAQTFSSTGGVGDRGKSAAADKRHARDGDRSGEKHGRFSGRHSDGSRNDFGNRNDRNSPGKYNDRANDNRGRGIGKGGKNGRDRWGTTDEADAAMTSNLRKYAGGRFEDVVRSFEQKRARNAGVKGRPLTKGFKKLLAKRGALSTGKGSKRK